jgi:hypothetical protein
MQRSVLLEMVELSRGNDLVLQTPLLELRRVFPTIPGGMQFGFDENLRQWVEGANAAEIETACMSLVPFFPHTGFFLKLGVEQSNAGHIVSASFNINSLEEALHWMVWQDVFQNHPFLFCEECRALFQPDSQHEKKYCSTGCARRKASRDYERRKRKGKNINGSQKTR